MKIGRIFKSAIEAVRGIFSKGKKKPTPPSPEPTKQPKSPEESQKLEPKPEPPKEPEPDKNITELLTWLKETAKSYEWPGAEYFPDQEEIREETVMQGAQDIADEIEKVPRGKWAQLYKALKDSLGDVRDAIEDLVYMDYEKKGDKDNFCRGSWANTHYNDVMKSVLDVVKSFE